MNLETQQIDSQEIPLEAAVSDNESNIDVNCDCAVNKDAEDYDVPWVGSQLGHDTVLDSSRYHGRDDPRIPAVFKCFECRLRSTQASVVMGETSLKEYILKYSELALFRRALKIIEIENPRNVAEFRKHVGASPPVAAQLWKRLEAESLFIGRSTFRISHQYADFVGPEYVHEDGLGMLEQRTIGQSKKATGRTRIPKTSKTQYTKNPAISTMIKTYFDPSEEMERKHVGLGVKAYPFSIGIGPLVDVLVVSSRVGPKPLSPSRRLNGVGASFPDGNQVLEARGEQIPVPALQGKQKTPGKRKRSDIGTGLDESTSSTLRRSKRIKVSVPQRDIDLDW
ncbi:DNA binding protein [Serendipita sp. 399]|nr:DNA binding protein [Serendipita sp. 399]